MAKHQCNAKNCAAGNATKADIEKYINPTKLGMAIQIRNEKKDGKMIITCMSKSDTREVCEKAKKNLESKYEISETKLKKPRIKIPGFNENYESM